MVIIYNKNIIPLENSSTFSIGVKSPRSLLPINSFGPVGQSVEMQGIPLAIASIKAFGIPS